jgi:iron complex outermembrane receptor protein
MNCRNLLCTFILPALLLLFTTTAFAQTKTVAGRVTDAAGAGAASITVSAKGQNIATTTNETGQFSITVPQSVTTLVFSSVGFTTSEVNIGTQTNMNVVLQIGSANLNEVVVVAYGTKQKRRSDRLHYFSFCQRFSKGIYSFF